MRRFEPVLSEPPAGTESAEVQEKDFEGQIAWTAELRAAVAPFRGWEASHEAPSSRKLWAGLRKTPPQMDKESRLPWLLEQLDFEDLPQLLKSPEPPPARSPAEDARYFAFWSGNAQQMTIVDLLIAQSGLAATVEALLHAQNSRSWRTNNWRIQKGHPEAGWLVGIGAWLALRRHLSAADPEPYAQARALAEASRNARRGEPTLLPRIQIAFAFADEPWATEDAKEILANKGSRQVEGSAYLLTAVDSLELAAALIPQFNTNYSIWPEWNTHRFSLTLLARFGEAVLPLLVELDENIGTEFRKDVAGTISLIGNEEALLWLLERGDLLGARLASFTRHSPRIGLLLCAEHAAHRGKSAEIARMALRSLVADHLETARSTAEHTSPAATTLLRGLIAEQEEIRCVFPESWPEVLRSPPWLHKEASGSKLDSYPAQLPKLPEFWDAKTLSPPRLENGGPLPPEALASLAVMLSFTSHTQPYAGILQVKEACDAASLARFAWDLFQRWLAYGAPAKERWAFLALGLLGDDVCARGLASLIRAWPGEAAHARAVFGLDILASMGSDVSLMLLQSIADKVKFQGLKAKAQEKIAELAKERGLSAEELADRLAPDCGLGEDGILELDFGPRRFRVSFDEQLRPFVLDEHGKLLKDLPKPNKADDEALAQGETERYKALKKDARSLASLQISRLERAMTSERRFSREVFETFFAHHPLIRHLARRLIWAAHTEEGISYFRVAEDGTYGDAEDGAWLLPQQAEIAVPHALNLPAATARAFVQIFADYQNLQPFPQLGREVFALTEEEKAAKELTRFAGREVPTGKLLGLEKYGWLRGEPQDAGGSNWYERSSSQGYTCYLCFLGGIFAGDATFLPTQTLDVLTLARNALWPEKEAPFSALTDIEASEILRDLSSLFS